MGLLNQWILSQSDDGTLLYHLTTAMSFVVLAAVAVWYLRRERLPWLRSLAAVAVGFYLTMTVQSLVLWGSAGFPRGGYGAEANLAVGFVYLPLIGWLLAAVFALPKDRVSELLAVSVTAFHALSRLACVFTGCCYGYPCSWGLWSIQTLENRFPVVLVESAYTLAILAVLLIRIRRRGGDPDGKSLPLMLVLYGLCRFGSEFLRDNEKLFWGLSALSLHALFMAAVGAALLLWLTRREHKATPAESNLPTVKGRRR